MKATSSVNRVGIQENAVSFLSARDILWILSGGLILIALIFLGEFYLSSTNYLLFPRFVLGLVYVLFVPGYLLQAALFPHQEDLDGRERTGLSLGLSIAVLPVLALILDRLPWGLRLWSIVVGQGAMIFILGLAATWRRYSLPRGGVYTPVVNPRLRQWWQGLELADQLLYLLSAGALLFAGFALAWVVLVPSDAEFMTEFYMLGNEGLAEDYPRQAQVGEPINVTIGIHNLEHTAHIYQVEIWAVDPWMANRQEMVAKSEPIKIERDAKLEQTIEWSMPWAADDQRVEILLFVDHRLEPYRRLILWMNVRE